MTKSVAIGFLVLLALAGLPLAMGLTDQRTEGAAVSVFGDPHQPGLLDAVRTHL